MVNIIPLMEEYEMFGDKKINIGSEVSQKFRVELAVLPTDEAKERYLHAMSNVAAIFKGEEIRMIVDPAPPHSRVVEEALKQGGEALQAADASLAAKRLRQAQDYVKMLPTLGLSDFDGRINRQVRDSAASVVNTAQLHLTIGKEGFALHANTAGLDVGDSLFGGRS